MTDRTFAQNWLVILSFALALPTAALPLSFAEEAEPKQDLRIKVKGQVVDDKTGEPITQMMIQAGRIDPADPKKITWGYSERRTSSKTGRFSYTVNWSDGWTARVVVDGYEPQPIITKPPAPGIDAVDVVLRMKPGKPIRGRIIDHEGRPVTGANVFAISPRGLNLYEGQAHDRYMNRVDPRAKSVATDKEGRFELSSGGSTSLAVSSKSLDAWAAQLDPKSEDELLIKLPAPTKLTITLDIEGADAETEIFYQLLTHMMDGFDKVQSTRTLTVKNGESFELTSLPPGKYQFCRQRMHRYDNVGNGAMIDRTFIELKAGESQELKFVRKKANRISGVVTWPKDAKLAGVILSVKSLESIPDPWGGHSYTTTFDSKLIAGKAQVNLIEGKSVEFKTEALVPGKYQVEVIAYTPMTPAEMRLSGIRRPDYTTSQTVTVTESSGPNMVVIKLEAAIR